MSKHHAAENDPAVSEMAWIQGLAKPLETESAARLPFHESPVGHSPRHAGADRDDAAPAAEQNSAVAGSDPSGTDAATAAAATGDAATGEAATGEAATDEAATADAAGAPVATADAAPAPAGKRGATRPTRARFRKPLLIGAAAALSVLTVGGGTVTAMDKTVSIVVDGKTQRVTTMADSVGGALAAAGISPNSHDTLAPAANATISDGSTIILDHGRLVTVTVDGQRRQLWTTARTVDQALAEMGAQTSDLASSANRSRSIPVEGLSLNAFTLRRVAVSVGGGSATPSTTTAGTVGDLLAAQQVTLGALDTVFPPLTTPVSDGLVVTVTRIAVTNTSTTVQLPQPAPVTVGDPAIAKGSSKVVQQGRPGSQLITYTVKTVNGREMDRTESGRRIVAAPVATITHVGTRTTFTYVGQQVFTNDTSFGVNWDGLANCESTHNPQAINAYPSAGLPTYGLFQFDLPTWESVGGSGNPIDATPEEQLMRAKLLFQQRGLQPWTCGYAAH